MISLYHFHSGEGSHCFRMWNLANELSDMFIIILISAASNVLVIIQLFYSVFLLDTLLYSSSEEPSILAFNVCFQVEQFIQVLSYRALDNMTICPWLHCSLYLPSFAQAEALDWKWMKMIEMTSGKLMF